jgi:Amt family ammonium transporter
MSIMMIWSAGLADSVAVASPVGSGVIGALRILLAAGMDLDLSLMAACLAFLVPAGLTMIAASASNREAAPSVAAVGLVAVALGVVVYGVVGFGLQFGGLGLVSDLAGARDLRSEWSPVDRVWGPGWGIIGLDGFLVVRDSLDEEVLSAFLYYAALGATALCIPMLALARRLRFLALLGLGLVFAVLVYPVYGNWVWGGGYLSQLGTTIGLGHGFVDFAGAGTLHSLGGFFALAAILAFGARVRTTKVLTEPPPVHFPVLGLLGAFLLLLGWCGLVAGSPLLPTNISYVRILLNVLLAGCSGILVSSLYVWFVRGAPDLLMVSRGLVASLVAISASCAFVPSWAALAIGSIAGLVLPMSIYLFDAKLRLDDHTAAVATHGISGLWGLISVGVFADGSSGAGWNGVGATEYLASDGQGVSGLLVGSGFQVDWPGQLYAQVTGIVALLLLALGVSWLILYLVQSLSLKTEALRSGARQPDDEGSPDERGDSGRGS